MERHYHGDLIASAYDATLAEYLHRCYEEYPHQQTSQHHRGKGIEMEFGFEDDWSSVGKPTPSGSSSSSSSDSPGKGDSRSKVKSKSKCCGEYKQSHCCSHSHPLRSRSRHNPQRTSRSTQTSPPPDTGSSTILSRLNVPMAYIRSRLDQPVTLLESCIIATISTSVIVTAVLVVTLDLVEILHRIKPRPMRELAWKVMTWWFG